MHAYCVYGVVKLPEEGLSRPLFFPQVAERVLYGSTILVLERAVGWNCAAGMLQGWGWHGLSGTSQLSCY